jgi:hypothetical protein
VRILGELKENLANKAKKEKKSDLSTIFLLNNYHYIQKTIQNSELWSLIPNRAAFLDEYARAINEQRDIYKARY